MPGFFDEGPLIQYFSSPIWLEVINNLWSLLPKMVTSELQQRSRYMKTVYDAVSAGRF